MHCSRARFVDDDCKSNVLKYTRHARSCIFETIHQQNININILRTITYFKCIQLLKTFCK